MTTPDTTSYMTLGYAFFFVVMGIYVASLYIRNNNLKRDLEMLKALEEDEKKRAKK